MMEEEGKDCGLEQENEKEATLGGIKRRDFNLPPTIMEPK